ncbi:Hypothetical predicted protein [Podarcis lilfordi]|uniref:Uncharacterized protein n=1 Tax=Podarcis lilfordi TaxID=74358 RepID=A0AA35L3A3_9SAUR|nr:Hypothetical predicted protein [Podarcis lilfordi]
MERRRSRGTTTATPSSHAGKKYQHVLDHGSYTKQKITNSDSKQVYSEASSTQTHCACK